ncbi:Mevalonate kinase [Lachnellula suecica]|uniref:mevalonate kinase n=1 Tax=Lachnellula suecica TaxID=602035 RepID=A0A8T9CAY6_9HELO|nr:Mevalonate kinase [Lachnellula suecica]
MPPQASGRGSDKDLAENMENTHINGNGSAKRRRPLANRKQSSPMMVPFMVSAPGKVIVFGEHAVVHGKPAIAAAISLRSYLLVTALSKTKRIISLRFPDINLSHTWNIDDLPWATFAHPSKKKHYFDRVTSLDQDLIEAIQPHLENVSEGAPDDIRKVHKNSASCFLYLLLSLGSPTFNGCLYTLRSTIPIAAGLGSSASISVCISAALLLQIRTLSGPHPDQPAEEGRMQIERVNHWAFVGEMCIHGTPSGVDNTVATQGKAVVFQRSELNKPPNVKPLWNFPELPLLLVNTKTARSTKTEVEKVKQLKVEHPQITESILHAIGKVTDGARQIIEHEDFDSEELSSLEEVGKLMTINHGLLVALGVSHPRLERIRELVDHEGIGWTKLTGAGGGGCAITLLKPGVTRDRVLRLEKTLDDEGYEKFETTVGCDGVGVLWPAVLKNGIEDDEGGEEIDQEKFLNAEGIDGVEELVGVRGTFTATPPRHNNGTQTLETFKSSTQSPRASQRMYEAFFTLLDFRFKVFPFYPSISALHQDLYASSRPFLTLAQTKGISSLTPTEKAAYANSRFLETGVWKTWPAPQQKEFWAAIEKQNLPIPLPKPQDLGKDKRGRDLETYSVGEYKQYRKREREFEGLRRESVRFRNRREKAGPGELEGEFDEEKNRRKLLGVLQGKKMGIYEGDPEWDDVVPIPQDDGEGALAQIAYTDEYAEAMGYLRAVMAAKEHSQRVLTLTEHIISLNPAHYTVWLYRSRTLFALSSSIPEELAWVNEVALENQKNYQIWHHRQLLIDTLYPTLSPADLKVLEDSERNFMTQMFSLDAKNYHVWSYRSHLCRKLNMFNESELRSLEELLRRDVRNNSAWSHRFFVVFSDPSYSTPDSKATEHDPKIPEEILDREIEFGKAATFEAPQNQSPWNYLRGVLKKGDRPLASLECFAGEFVKIGEGEEDVRSSHALDFLADAWAEKGENEKADKALRLLGDKYDRIRKNYWEWKRASLQKAI